MLQDISSHEQLINDQLSLWPQGKFGKKDWVIAGRLVDRILSLRLHHIGLQTSPMQPIPGVYFDHNALQCSTAPESTHGQLWALYIYIF